MLIFSDRKMKNEYRKPRSRSLSSRQDRSFSVHVSKDSVVGGWSGIQRSASRTFSATAYLQEVNHILKNRTLSCGTNAFSKFMILVDKLGSEKKSNGDKISLIECLIGLLEGYPILILNLAIFLPDEYVIEIQRDAVIVKIYESEESLSAVNTGHLRIFNNSPCSAFAWLGKDITRFGKPLTESTGMSQGRTRMKNTSRQSDKLPLISLKSEDISIRSRRKSLSSKGLPSRSMSHVSDISKQNMPVKPAANPVICNDVHLLEENTTSTDMKTLQYILKIKRQYADRPEVYRRFLQLLKDMHSGTLEGISVISEIVTLFNTCPSLIFGFNYFLPHGSRIILLNSNDGSADPNITAPKYILEHIDTKGQTVEGELFP